jgi:Domain of unknown function (DUF4440)
MSFSMMRPMLAGGLVAVALVGSVQAQEDPKAAFEARYAEMSTAMLAKDRAATEKLLAPDYQSTDIRGDAHNRAEVLDKLADLPPELANAKPETKVLTAKVTGDSAAVDSQMTMQMKRPDENGEEMTLDIAIVSADTWVNRGGTWLLQKSVQKELTVSKDGEVVFRQAN